MGLTEIRTVGKVSFDKPAAEQEVLHVSQEDGKLIKAEQKY
jgi:hypothetical protein